MVTLKQNLGKNDRIIRVLLAAFTGVLYLTGVVSGVVAVIVILAGLILLATALVSTCPIYLALGLSSKRTVLGSTTEKKNV